MFMNMYICILYTYIYIYILRIAYCLLPFPEELSGYVNAKVGQRGCLGLCGQGPNCLLEPPSDDGNK